MEFPVDERNSGTGPVGVRVQVEFSSEDVALAFSENQEALFRSIFFDPQWDTLKGSEKLTKLADLAKLVEDLAANLGLKGGRVVPKTQTKE
jgi:hypothetical protein